MHVLLNETLSSAIGRAIAAKNLKGLKSQSDITHGVVRNGAVLHTKSFSLPALFPKGLAA